MRNVDDYAKYFMKEATDLNDTYDGNMKLQKLLTFANLISMALNNKPLFKENLLAYRDGCVIKPIIDNYRRRYKELKESSETLVNNFNESELEILDITLGIFDKLSARELSNLNHEFDFWKKSYDPLGRNCIVKNEEVEKELDIIKSMVESYKNRDSNYKFETINGITFYYNPNNLDLYKSYELNGEYFKIFDELYDFSKSEDAEDNSYTVYLDEDGELVIF